MTLDRYSEWVTSRGSFILEDATDCALLNNEKFKRRYGLSFILTVYRFRIRQRCGQPVSTGTCKTGHRWQWE